MRTFPRKLRFWTALIVVLCMSALDFSPAMAGLAPSRTSGATTIASARDADMLVAQRALENKIVAQKLRDYGVPVADAQLRLASMSDRDLHTLASASRGLPSGGDGTTGAIIGVLVIVILVIVILRLTNRRVIVK
ncbi:MAG: PA2779 family protein [Acidobacteriota bacterium]